jgi:hypothetical protein
MTNIKSLILKWGMSSELEEALKGVAQVERLGGEGQPKYSLSIRYELGRSIAGRDYARGIFELCHLVRVAHHCEEQNYISFFYSLEVARASAFEAVARSSSKSTLIHPGTSTIDIIYPDGNFSINYTRMPYLSAVMEFLISFLGYPGVDEVLQGLILGQATNSATQVAANDMSRLLYDKLKGHLPTQQYQRNLRVALDYLEDNSGGVANKNNYKDTQVNPFSETLECITDASILNFWIERSADEGDGDFKTFTRVFRLFFNLTRICYDAEKKNKVEATTDNEMVFEDPAKTLFKETKMEDYQETFHKKNRNSFEFAELHAHVESDDNPDDLYFELDEQPKAAVKFLNDKERGRLKTIIDSAALAMKFPLSILRSEVFGKEQARLIHTQRYKLKPVEMKKEIEKGPSTNYLGVIEEFKQLSFHIRSVSLASLYVLAYARKRYAIHLIRELAPEVNLIDLLKGYFDVDEDGNMFLEKAGDDAEDDALNTVSEILAHPERITNPQLAQLMKESEKAFKNISRRGFMADDKDNKIIQDQHEEGIPAINRTRIILENFLDSLSEMYRFEQNHEIQFDQDRMNFMAQFNVLYWNDVS